MNPIQTIVYYHRLDFDGIVSGAVARYWLGDAPYIGWDYKDPEPERPADDVKIYMLDISIDGLMDHPGLVWIDHHKTAIDKYPETIPGYRIDGVAACRLAGQWFKIADAEKHVGWANEACARLTRMDYAQHSVIEPLLVRLVGEYDVWDHRDPRALFLQHGLTAIGFSVDEHDVHDYFTQMNIVNELCETGETIERYAQTFNSDVAANNAYFLTWEGVRFAVLNTAKGNSMVFGDFAVRHADEIDAVLVWRHTGGEAISFSLYGPPKGLREDIDLSVIARKYGGGGHRNACGFRLAFEDVAQILKHTVSLH